MGDKNAAKQFKPAEAKLRFEAALRGARIAGPLHKESVTPKRHNPQRGKSKKTSV
jgi:hypothetical protein